MNVHNSDESLQKMSYLNEIHSKIVSLEESLLSKLTAAVATGLINLGPEISVETFISSELSILSSIKDLLSNCDDSSTSSKPSLTPAAPSGRVSSVFQKVNGKSVVISEEALKKSESFLRDNSGSATNASSSGVSSGRVSSLFQRGNGRSVVISEEAQRKSESFLRNTEPERNVIDSTPVSVPYSPAEHPSLFTTTYSSIGTPLVSSGDAYKRNEVFMYNSPPADLLPSQPSSLSSPIVSSLPVTGNSQALPPPAGGRVSSVFQKVSGKPVVISEEARHKSESFFNHADGNKRVSVATTTAVGAAALMSPAKVTPSTQSVSSNSGRVSSVFQKVNGRPVIISEEAHRKSVSFLGDAGSSVAVLESIATPTVVAPVGAALSQFSQPAPSATSSSSSSGRVSSVFQKVNGRPVVISEEAHRRSEAFLNNNQNSEGNNVSNTPLSVNSSVTPSLTQTAAGLAPPKGRVSSVFQKVNGQSVVISEEAVKKGASFLSSDDSSVAVVMAAPTAVMPMTQPAATAVGGGRVSSVFQKVNGKPVVISEEAHRKSESFLSSAAGGGVSSEVVTVMPVTAPLVTPAKDSNSALPAGNSYSFPVPYGAPTSIISTASKPVVASVALSTVSSVTPATPSVDLSLVQDPALARDLEWFFSLVEPPAVMTPDAVVAVVSSPVKPSPPRIDFIARVLQLTALNSANLPHALTFEENGVSFKVTTAKTAATAAAGGKLSAVLSSYGPLLTDLYEKILPENVDETLLSWLNMQLRWICWTLASYERRYPDQYAFDLLTVNSLVRCLQWRYDIYSKPAATAAEGALSQMVPNKAVVTPYTRRSSANQSSAARGSLTKVPAPSPSSNGLGRSSAVKHQVRVKQHVDAKTHFSKRGSMSPLQRSCDIACFIWPMVLCFSASPGGTSGVRIGAVYEVCDGWWWSEVKLDRELQQLVDRGLLRDGVKIAVFSGVFQAPQNDADVSSSSSTKHILHLNFNNVRLAHKAAKLGQIPPESLLRGVSMASTTESGGPIFCIRGRIVDVSCVMSKIKRSVEPSETGTSKSVELNTILNHSESRELKKVLEKLKQKTVDSLENMPELSMASLLDSYGCDDDVIEDFKKLENGEDSMICSQRIRELSGIKSGLEQHRHKVAMALLNAKTSKYHIDEARFVDVLMECAVSGLHFWMRMMYRGDNDDDVGSSSNRVDAKFSLGSQFRVGNEIAVANVKRIHTIGCMPLVMCSSGSRVRVLHAAVSKTGGGSAFEFKQQLITAAGAQTIASLRDVVVAFSASEVAATAEADKYEGKFAVGKRDVSFVCTIVDWVEQKPAAAGEAVEDGLISITIFAIDSSRTCVELRYSYPVELVGKISWLGKKNVIYVQYGVIGQVDEKYDVIQVNKGDHTNVLLVKAAAVVAERASGSSPAKKTTPSKRKYDDLAARTPVKEVSESKELVQYDVPFEMFENEHRRYQALRNNANQFQSYQAARKTRKMIIEKCHRVHWNRVKLLALVERSCGGDEDSQNADSQPSAVEYTLSFEVSDGSVVKAVVDSSMVSVAQTLVDQIQMQGAEEVCNVVAADCFSVTENRSISSQSSVNGESKSYLFSNEYKRIIWLGVDDVVK